jgi:hypothetical protein
MTCRRARGIIAMLGFTIPGQQILYNLPRCSLDWSRRPRGLGRRHPKAPAEPGRPVTLRHRITASV